MVFIARSGYRSLRNVLALALPRFYANRDHILEEIDDLGFSTIQDRTPEGASAQMAREKARFLEIRGFLWQKEIIAFGRGGLIGPNFDCGHAPVAFIVI